MLDEEEVLNQIKGPTDLEAMSVEELRQYKRQLENEVERVEAEINKKEEYRKSLDSAFK